MEVLVFGLVGFAIAGTWLRAFVANSGELATAGTNLVDLAKLPVGRWGKVEEIGAIACYLCSDLAGFVTGTDILIDGGWTVS